ncbi:hypothetical protein F5884DRAFT_81782 [Xylogone sp. PMI_703]|nr:hypothetical protein F5884DRAFT_81782 [Xylogone sp. PMI_703]
MSITSNPHPKAEAAQLSNESLVDPSPSYGDHVNHALYTESGSSHNRSSSHPDSISERARTSQLSTRPLQKDEYRSLTLDKSLIYPSIPPSQALYSLSYTLNSLGSEITLRRSVPGLIRPDGTVASVVDKDLFHITRPPLSLASFEIKGLRRSTYPGTAYLELKRGIKGKYWECKFKGQLVLRQKGGVWVDEDGKEIAREQNELPRSKSKDKHKAAAIDFGVKEHPKISFVDDVDQLLMDLMIAVWCAKTWYCATYGVKSARPTMKEAVNRVRLGQEATGRSSNKTAIW